MMKLDHERKWSESAELMLNVGNVLRKNHAGSGHTPNSSLSC